MLDNFTWSPTTPQIGLSNVLNDIFVVQYNGHSVIWPLCWACRSLDLYDTSLSLFFPISPTFLPLPSSNWSRQDFLRTLCSLFSFATQHILPGTLTYSYDSKVSYHKKTDKFIKPAYIPFWVLTNIYNSVLDVFTYKF